MKQMLQWLISVVGALAVVAAACGLAFAPGVARLYVFAGVVLGAIASAAILWPRLAQALVVISVGLAAVGYWFKTPVLVAICLIAGSLEPTKTGIGKPAMEIIDSSDSLFPELRPWFAAAVAITMLAAAAWALSNKLAQPVPIEPEEDDDE